MPPVKHALLSASSASRWLVCTAAPRFEEGLPESTSEYAEEGRLAHAIGELKVTKKCTPMSTRTYNTRLNKLKKDPLYTPEMDKTTDLYLEHITEQVMAYDTAPTVAVEVQVDFSDYVPGGFGTCDCCIIGGDLLSIVDYKHGKGVPVSAVGNPQMRLYALGALHRYAAALSTVFGSRFQRTMHNIGEGAWIGGKSWVFPYYDQNGELAFQRFPADEVLPFWADADHTILDAAVHVYVVLEYDETEQTRDVVKVEVMHGGGVDCFVRRDDGTLEPDDFARSGPYITTTDPQTGKETSYNWERIPLVCFKSSHHEIPLLSRVKCLQDAYNNIISNFANQMEEDIHSTILVIKNYDGEDLGRLRANLATYGIIKVRSYEGSEGGVDTLQIEVNAENYKVLLSLLKDAIIENARGYDAKDDRMSGNPNQMNIQSMYSDIDLDANGIEMEFQASMEELLWFVNQHLANTGRGNFEGTEVKVIFDRDVLINETEVINNCKNSVGILSDETIVKMHPWVSDPEQELQRIKDEKEEAMADPYQAAFMKNRQNGGDGSGNPVTGQNGGDGDAQE